MPIAQRQQGGAIGAPWCVSLVPRPYLLYLSVGTRLDYRESERRMASQAPLPAEKDDTVISYPSYSSWNPSSSLYASNSHPTPLTHSLPSPCHTQRLAHLSLRTSNGNFVNLLSHSSPHTLTPSLGHIQKNLEDELVQEALRKVGVSSLR